MIWVCGCVYDCDILESGILFCLFIWGCFFCIFQIFSIFHILDNAVPVEKRFFFFFIIFQFAIRKTIDESNGKRDNSFGKDDRMQLTQSCQQS